MSNTISIISPIDGSVVAERKLATEQEINHCLQSALSAKNTWKKKSVAERATICHKAIDVMRENTEEIAKEITLLMGRPVKSRKSLPSSIE